MANYLPSVSLLGTVPGPLQLSLFFIYAFLLSNFNHHYRTIGVHSYLLSYYSIFHFQPPLLLWAPTFLPSNPTEVESISRALAPELALFTGPSPAGEPLKRPVTKRDIPYRGDQHCMCGTKPDGFAFDNFPRSMQSFSPHKGSRDSIASGPPDLFFIPPFNASVCWTVERSVAHVRLKFTGRGEKTNVYVTNLRKKIDGRFGVDPSIANFSQTLPDGSFQCN